MLKVKSTGKTAVAVCSRSFSKNPILRTELEARYPGTKFNDAGLPLKGDGLIDFLRGFEKAIIALEPITERILTALPEIRVISKFGVGFDKLDLDAMTERGISLGWSGGINKRSVSELTICFAINLLRHVSETNREIRAGTWRLKPGRQLSDQTVGIIGCGHVGKDLAILLRGFGCRVLAYDIRNFSKFYTTHGIEDCSFEKLLETSNIVSLHLPFDASTKNIISESRIRLMRTDALLINTARGGLVDEQALKSALKNGRLAGAAFDVFTTEPPDDPELIGLPNVLATPHLGGSTHEGILAMGRAAIAGLDQNCIPRPGLFPV
ncbi:MAG: phosphoglycerate dehydrogenase [Rhodospirillaceae bacterium TMED8]|nr:phosphoglycerate dehydrogenase [Magnetovibrio sp.]OUT47940.1 MAG: phosphoglycerate dehydrogenase [Rhodospirillaceae bacterium TMED8]